MRLVQGKACAALHNALAGYQNVYGRIKIILTKQGDKARLLKMAKQNAEDYLEKSVDKIKHKDDMTVNACKRLQEFE